MFSDLSSFTWLTAQASGYPHWSSRSPADQANHFVSQNRATGQDTEIAAIKNPYTGLTVSPDRKTVLISAGVRTGSNIRVVDNFR